MKVKFFSTAHAQNRKLHGLAIIRVRMILSRSHFTLKVSLHPGVLMGTGEFIVGGNPALD